MKYPKENIEWFVEFRDWVQENDPDILELTEKQYRHLNLLLQPHCRFLCPCHAYFMDRKIKVIDHGPIDIKNDPFKEYYSS